jgi:hypothetical protein
MEKMLTIQDKLAYFIAAKGYAARPDENWAYGAIAENYKEIKDHMRTCSVLTYGHLNEEHHWYAFQGTFASDREKIAMTVRVTCRCGEVAVQPFIYEAGPGEAITEFIKYVEEQGW